MRQMMVESTSASSGLMTSSRSVSVLDGAICSSGISSPVAGSVYWIRLWCDSSVSSSIRTPVWRRTSGVFRHECGCWDGLWARFSLWGSGCGPAGWVADLYPFTRPCRGGVDKARLRGSWGDAHGWSLGSELRSKPIQGARARARHNSIQASFVPDRYHRERGGVRQVHGGRDCEAHGPEVAVSVVRVHDQGAVRPKAGVLRVAALGPGRMALGDSVGSTPAGVPHPWGSHRGGPVRPAGFSVHPRL